MMFLAVPSSKPKVSDAALGSTRSPKRLRPANSQALMVASLPVVLKYAGTVTITSLISPYIPLVCLTNALRISAEISAGVIVISSPP